MSSAPQPNNALMTILYIIGGLWLFNQLRYSGMVNTNGQRIAGATPVYGSYLNQPTYGAQQQLLPTQQQGQVYQQLGSAFGKVVNKFFGDGSSPTDAVPKSTPAVASQTPYATSIDDGNPYDDGMYGYW